MALARPPDLLLSLACPQELMLTLVDAYTPPATQVDLHGRLPVPWSFCCRWHAPGAYVEPGRSLRTLPELLSVVAWSLGSMLALARLLELLLALHNILELHMSLARPLNFMLAPGFSMIRRYRDSHR